MSSVPAVSCTGHQRSWMPRRCGEKGGTLTGPSPVDLVVVPSIDGNFDPSIAEMIPFERQFQAFHSVQNYLLLNEVLGPGFAMPLVDTDELRKARIAFVARFCERPYYFARAATPQVLLDLVDKIM